MRVSNRPRKADGSRRSTRRIVEFALAFVLFAAAIAKLYAFIRTGHWSESSVLRGEDPGLIAVVVQLELLLAVWLCAGVYDDARFISSMGCFALFACVAGYEAAHRVPSCGCFGEVAVPPWATLVLDVCAVTALWFTGRRRLPVTSGGDGRVKGRRRRMVWGVVALAGVSGPLWASAWIHRVSAGNSAAQRALRVLAPDAWVGHEFPLFGEIPGSGALRAGRWLVVLYHDDCGACREAVPEYQKLARACAGRADCPGLAFVAMPPESGGAPALVGASAFYSRLALRPDREWFATTPVCVAMWNGRVIFSAEGEDAMHPPPLKSLRWQ